MNIENFIKALLPRLLFKSKLIVMLGMLLLFFSCTDNKMDSKGEENKNISEVVEKINQEEVKGSDSKDLTGNYYGFSKGMHDIMIAIELEDDTHYIAEFSILQNCPQFEFNCSWSVADNCSVSIDDTVKNISYSSEISLDQYGKFSFNYSDGQTSGSFSHILSPEKTKATQKERIPFKKNEGRIEIGGKTFHYYYFAQARCFFPTFTASIDLIENAVDVPTNTSYTRSNSFYDITFATIESAKTASHPYEKRMLVKFLRSICLFRRINVYINYYGQVAVEFGGNCSNSRGGGRLILEKD